MKTLALSVLMACFSYVFSASSSADSSCAFDLDEDLTLATQLYRALPDGIWTGLMQDGSEAVLQFHASGKADWFTYGKNGLSGFDGFTWAVRPLNEDEARLELVNRDNSKQLSFAVEIACQSMELAEASNGISLFLKHGSSASNAAYRKKETLLAGKWENTTYPFDLKSIEGAYLKYTFHKNGKFERMLGCADRNIRESGQWWLAKEGQHLVMRLDNGETTVAEIKHVEMDELVLKHILYCEDKAFTTGERDFFFNRQ